MKTQYRIEWSYPSSANARRFGFGKTGCWTIQLQIGENPPKALEAFETKEQAQSVLDSHLWITRTK